MATQDHYPVNKQFTAMSHDTSPLPSGDKLICDSRYRNIINRLNAMIELISTKPGSDLTAEADQLLDAMMDHIDSENGVMEMAGYSNTVHHRSDHQLICFLTAGLRYRFSKGRDVLPEDLSYVRQLWLAHMQMYDRAFEEFLAC
jgi:hemerythrin